MRQLMIEMTEEDVGIADGIAHRHSVARVEVLRWAVRYYGLRGPWTRDVEDRVELIGTNRQCVIGPRLEGVGG